MSVTIKDVARNCGLSISTVSKVFNGYPDISEATRRQVMEAAREIGYKPNALARALKTNRSYNLGVLFVDDNISGLTHPFFAAVLNAFKAEAERQGYDITFINHNIGTMEMTYLEHCRYRNVDGVCLACVDFYSAEVAELVESGIPCVTIDHMFEGHPSIISDNLNGIRMLVDRAVALGHRRIAYIHGQRNSLVTENRIQGFYSAMEATGWPCRRAICARAATTTARTSAATCAALLERPERPTCILLPDDATYFGALEVHPGARVIRARRTSPWPGTTACAPSRWFGPGSPPCARTAPPWAARPPSASSTTSSTPPPPTCDPVLIPTELMEGETLGRAE